MNAEEALKRLGIRIGHKSDEEAGTGCSVFLFDEPPVAGVSVRGGAPASHETELLRAGRLIERIHGLLLTGGSAYGLCAASGVMRYLEERGIGHDTGVCVVPIVPAAAIYDLKYKTHTVRPDASWGYEASLRASYTVKEGSVGAGCGATIGKILGTEHASKGGFGMCVTECAGICVVAFAVVNALGEVVDENGRIVAGIRKRDGFIASFDAMKSVTEGMLAGENTTLVVVATDMPLTKGMSVRLADVAHNGVAMAVRPAHTPFDGDTVFALSCSTGKQVDDPRMLMLLFATAEVTVRKAIIRAATGEKYNPNNC